MSIPTNDERREVAAKLRELDGRCECSMLDFMFALAIGDSMYKESVPMRLADLIEPEERTCRAECFPPGYEDNLHNMVCSECGALVFGPVMPGDDRGSMFRFCPNCGARVVGR